MAGEPYVFGAEEEVEGVMFTAAPRGESLLAKGFLPEWTGQGEGLTIHVKLLLPIIPDPSKDLHARCQVGRDLHRKVLAIGLDTVLAVRTIPHITRRHPESLAYTNSSVSKEGKGEMNWSREQDRYTPPSSLNPT